MELFGKVRVASETLPKFWQKSRPFFLFQEEELCSLVSGTSNDWLPIEDAGFVLNFKMSSRWVLSNRVGMNSKEEFVLGLIMEGNRDLI